ncbi:PREDICTED: THUMP domain-containing protein 3 [Nanorana parkeri]|uniref:THUMP domain-containing protein 3 n=1 Tax=Nanorana parkeri TaxID=125878 RepID=UPI0008541074|nr:PREDICTED: THUMP domain-containing protein 3 [Nanorana parkeri]
MLPGSIGRTQIAAFPASDCFLLGERASASPAGDTFQEKHPQLHHRAVISQPELCVTVEPAATAAFRGLQHWDCHLGLQHVNFPLNLYKPAAFMKIMPVITSQAPTCSAGKWYWDTAPPAVFIPQAQAPLLELLQRHSATCCLHSASSGSPTGIAATTQRHLLSSLRKRRPAVLGISIGTQRHLLLGISIGTQRHLLPSLRKLKLPVLELLRGHSATCCPVSAHSAMISAIGSPAGERRMIDGCHVCRLVPVSGPSTSQSMHQNPPAAFNFCSIFQVHRLRSVDNLFVIVQEFSDFPFKASKEDALEDFKELASRLHWEKALKTWELNNNLKKKKRKKKPDKERKLQAAAAPAADGKAAADKETVASPAAREESYSLDQQVAESSEASAEDLSPEASSEDGVLGVGGDGAREETGSVLKFRVTCNRAGDKHSFTSNDAARDFGGAVQDHFQWKADMTNFDVEVLLNISYNEMLVGIALTEESLHRRNITHFGPTTLRSTLAYGMLRLCDLEPSDVIVDPMCGTGAIPIEGVSEWPACFFVAGDNSRNAVNRAASNICSLLKKQQNSESATQGLPIDTAQWDISRLPLRSGSVDVIITDMPFGKRIGSKKKNWDLYPACLQEMSRVCRAGTGRAVLLTHDRKCFVKALARAGHLWRKMHTVWVNIGGLHAGVYLLKRTALDLADSSGERLEENHPLSPDSLAKEE